MGDVGCKVVILGNTFCLYCRSVDKEAAQRTSDAAAENTQQVKSLRAQMLALQDKVSRPKGCYVDAARFYMESL